MSDIVEGRNPVLEALRGELDVQEVMIASGVKPNPVIAEIRSASASAGVPVRDVERRDLDTLSPRGAHQGVVARVAPFAYATLDDVISDIGDRASSLVVVLDHVTDPGNLGAVIRSAEALGADAVVIPKARAASVGAIAVKSAAGATAHLPVVLVTNIARTLAALKDASFWVAGASERADQPCWDARLDGRLALVLGSEGDGLSRLVEESCDFLVKIPLRGTTTSLNVAQAATVLLYEWGRGSER